MNTLHVKPHTAAVFFFFLFSEFRVLISPVLGYRDNLNIEYEYKVGALFMNKGYIEYTQRSAEYRVCGTWIQYSLMLFE